MTPQELDAFFKDAERRWGPTVHSDFRCRICRRLLEVETIMKIGPNYLRKRIMVWFPSLPCYECIILTATCSAIPMTSTASQSTPSCMSL